MQKASKAKPLPSLDPRTLGRPVHRLAVFTDRFKADLAEVFINGLNRRYRASFQLGELTMTRTEALAAGSVPGERWLTLSADRGRVAFSIDRKVLTAVLHYRYGLHEAPSVDDAQEHAPETATEARLTAMLGLQLSNILGMCIDTLTPHGDKPASVPTEFTPMPSIAFAPAHSWTITVKVLETTHNIEGLIRFRLDDEWMSLLLRQLGPLKDKAVASAPTSGNASPSLAARLPLTLVARLLEQDIALGVLLDMRVGDVLPVRLNQAHVLVDQSRLFTADVAEHKGKLCLTSFNDSE